MSDHSIGMIVRCGGGAGVVSSNPMVRITVGQGTPNVGVAGKAWPAAIVKKGYKNA